MAKRKSVKHRRKPKHRDLPDVISSDFEDVYQDLEKELDPNAIEKANFRSELDYDGYDNIEDYDNTVLGRNMDEVERTDRELNFEDRPAKPT